jgi:hypothetical protein
MNEQNYKKLLESLDTRTACIYLLIISSILYLVMFKKDKAAIIDKIFKTNLTSKYPNIQDFPKIIITILLVVNGIFLYLSYEALKEKEKTGDLTNLDAVRLTYYINIVQMTATILSAYNIFVNNAKFVSITR